MHSKRHDIDAIMGRVLRQARLASGHTLASMAAHCGVTQQQVQKYETGINRVSISRLFILSRVLGVTPADLIAQVQDLSGPAMESPEETEWERLQFAKPDYCRKIISGLASIRDTEVLQSVVHLLAVLEPDDGRGGL